MKRRAVAAVARMQSVGRLRSVTQSSFDWPIDETLVCGVDEAGRGPLAGPVYAAAVMLDPARPIEGLRDSKQLSAPRRAELAGLIRERAQAWAVASASVAEIDALNILQASLLAMRRAIESLSIRPNTALVDGNQPPRVDCVVRTVIRGDALHPCISAASILAKTVRDEAMERLHEQWPHYRFDQHKGYPTAQHLELLLLHGPCEHHRRSFAPVRELTAALPGTGGRPEPRPL